MYLQNDMKNYLRVLYKQKFIISSNCPMMRIISYAFWAGHSSRNNTEYKGFIFSSWVWVAWFNPLQSKWPSLSNGIYYYIDVRCNLLGMWIINHVMNLLKLNSWISCQNTNDNDVSFHQIAFSSKPSWFLTSQCFVLFHIYLCLRKTEIIMATESWSWSKICTTIL